MTKKCMTVSSNIYVLYIVVIEFTIFTMNTKENPVFLKSSLLIDRSRTVADRFGIIYANCDVLTCILDRLKK